MSQIIDWLVLAEKDSQAKFYESGLFDKGNAHGALTKGGRIASGASSILPGTVAIARFQGHIISLDYPELQDSKYSRETDGGYSRQDADGGLVESTLKPWDEMFNVYPIELDLNHLKYGFGPKIKSGGRDQSYVKKMLFTNLINIFKNNNVKNVIVATDFDSEGEEIFQLFRKKAYLDKRVKLDYQDGHIFRAHPNALDEASVKEMFKRENLRSYKDFEKTEMYKLHNQGFTRSIVDYEYGLSFGVLMRPVESKLGGRGKYGRLKNAVSGVVYQAEVKHDNFVASSNYRIDMKLPDGTVLKGTDKPITGLSDKGLVFEDSNQAHAFINSGSLPSKVDLTDKITVKQTRSPQLYNRNSLIIDALKVKDYEWSNILQSLYEKHQLLSYIRSDSKYINEAEFLYLRQLGQTKAVQNLLEKFVNDTIALNNWGKNDAGFDFTQQSDKRYVDSSKVGSHYAVVPTKKVPNPAIYDALASEEQTVYNLALKRTLAMFAGVSIYDDHKLVALNGMFTDSRKVVKTQGWRLVTGDFQKSDKITPAGMTDVTYIVSEVKAKQPSLFTKSTLLKLMESKNWGTPATRDATLDEMLRKPKKKWDAASLNYDKDKKGLRINDGLHAVIGQAMIENWIDLGVTGQLQTMLDNVSNTNDVNSIIHSFRELSQDIKASVAEYVHK